MKSRGRIIRRAAMGMFLNIVYFIGLYFAAWHLSFALLAWAAFMVPTAINSLVFWNATEKWRGRKQFVLFAMMAVVTMICYGVFACFFENSAGYAGYVEANLNKYHIPSELRNRTSRRFFAVLPIVSGFLCNIAVQYFVNGTRREITKEDIDKIFDKYNK